MGFGGNTCSPVNLQLFERPYVLLKFFVKSRVLSLFFVLALVYSSPSSGKTDKVSELPPVSPTTSEGKQIAEKIRELFPDAPYMVYVANCESSGLVHRENGQLIQNRDGSTAKGVFQVLMRVHEPEMKKMGLNPNRTDQYLAYVRHLYDERGLSPWAASSHCWKKHYRLIKRG